MSRAPAAPRGRRRKAAFRFPHNAATLPIPLPMTDLLTPELIIAFLTLSALEIVLGIDNIIFLSIMAAKLPPHQQAKARFWGLAGAMLTRILLLTSLSWLARLTAPLFVLAGHAVSGRDLILLGGGLFLIVKSYTEIGAIINGAEHDNGKPANVATSFMSVIVQIMILDIVFSLDSVITAIGMTNNLPIMIAAIVAAIIVMMFFSGPVSRFVEANVSIKILALAFLTLVGGVLVVEGFGLHVSKAYVYFAMAFSTAVELVHMRLRRIQARRGTFTP